MAVYNRRGKYHFLKLNGKSAPHNSQLQKYNQNFIEQRRECRKTIPSYFQFISSKSVMFSVELV